MEGNMLFLSYFFLRLLYSFKDDFFILRTSYIFNHILPLSPSSSQIHLLLLPPQFCGFFFSSIGTNLRCPNILGCVAFHLGVADLTEPIFLEKIFSPSPSSCHLTAAGDTSCPHSLSMLTQAGGRMCDCSAMSRRHHLLVALYCLY